MVQGAYGFSGSTGASFLELPFDPRASALGGANTALSADGFSARWNPAGLAFLAQPGLAATQLLYLEDTTNTFLGLAQPFHQTQGFGAALQYFRPGAITERNAMDQEIGTFNGYSWAGTLAYGRRLFETLSIGISGQRLQSKIADISASAWSVGAGVQWHPSPEWSGGAAIENVGTSVTFIDQADPLPLTGRAGAAYVWKHELTAAVEAVYKRGAGPSGHVGIEFPNEEEKGYAFRTGFNSEYRKELSGMAGFSAGVAVRILGQDVAYAWVPLSDLGMAHLFTVQFHWGGEEKASGSMHVEKDSDVDVLKDFSNE